MNGRPRLPDNVIQAIEELAANGTPTADIARTLGQHYEAVKGRLNRNPVTVRAPYYAGYVKPEQIVSDEEMARLYAGRRYNATRPAPRPIASSLRGRSA